jgi:excisionase family DNA binding protein
MEIAPDPERLEAARAAVPLYQAPATYTVPEIAILTQTSVRHIWRLVDAGRIPGRIKGLGRVVRFSRAAVDAWLAGRTAGRVVQ